MGGVVGGAAVAAVAAVGGGAACMPGPKPPTTKEKKQRNERKGKLHTDIQIEEGRREMSDACTRVRTNARMRTRIQEYEDTYAGV